MFPWLIVAKVGGETLKDHRLVMEVADEPLAQLVNTQNHKDKEVMGVVREWICLLLQYNILWLAKLSTKTACATPGFSSPRQVKQPAGGKALPRPHPLQDSILDSPWP